MCFMLIFKITSHKTFAYTEISLMEICFLIYQLISAA